MKKESIKLLAIYHSMLKNASYDNLKTGTTFSELKENEKSFITIKGSDTQAVDWIRNILPPLLALILYVLSIKNIIFLFIGLGLGIGHYGFIAGAFEVLSNIDRKQKEYYIFGFSLGGGISVALATFLLLMGKKVHLITAGSPRTFTIFSVFFYISILLKATHFKNRGDIVPRTPPNWLGFFNAGKTVKPDTQYKYEGRSHAFEVYRNMITDYFL